MLRMPTFAECVVYDDVAGQWISAPTRSRPDGAGRSQVLMDRIWCVEQRMNPSSIERLPADERAAKREERLMDVGSPRRYHTSIAPSGRLLLTPEKRHPRLGNACTTNRTGTAPPPRGYLGAGFTTPSSLPSPRFSVVLPHAASELDISMPSPGTGVVAPPSLYRRAYHTTTRRRAHRACSKRTPHAHLRLDGGLAAA